MRNFGGGVTVHLCQQGWFVFIFPIEGLNPSLHYFT